MSKSEDMVNTLGFSGEEIKACCEKNGLLSVELEFTKKCNLRCLYCYTHAGKADEDELTVAELKSVIDQAKSMGAKKIILLGGGEPLIYEQLSIIVEYINSLGLQQVVFTNGTLIDQQIAATLLKNRVSVIIKHNSAKPDVQDELSGVKGSYEKIRRGMEILRSAGYPNGDISLGIQTVICRQNIDEIPYMWVWARERNIIPYVETLTVQGRAKENNNLLVSTAELKSLFEQLESIDNTRFGINWDVRPTIAAFSCKRHLYSCLIDSRGYVQPCTGIDIPVGNIRENSLSQILSSSNVIKKLRNIYDNLEGQCRDCEHGKECYGCRGNAYQLTGNYLASDPTCWHCGKVSNEDPIYLCKQ